MFKPQVSFHTEYNYDNVLKKRYVCPSVSINFKYQTYLSIFYNQWSERFAGKVFDRIQRFGSNLSSSFSKVISGGIHFDYGKAINYYATPPSLGYSQSFDIWGEIKPMEKLRTSIDFSRYWLWESRHGSEVYDTFVLYNKTTYQFSKHLSVRLVTQYYSATKRFQFDPLLSYELGPFTVFYIGLTSHFKDFEDPYGFRETDHQFFIKFRYLFRTTPEEIVGKVGKVF